ncbi:MAG: protein kinase domain-containing protein [Planctomycetota bacterium]
MSLEPGRILLHYRLLEQIGAGGMALVWRALDTKLDREVALKVLPESFARDRDRLERFAREAKLLASLHHPGIVTIHAVEEAEGLHFLTMELVEGRPLSKVIPADGLPLPEFFALSIPLVNAVAAAHARRITHRDLKPDNVMIGVDGLPKVLDFGLAKLREDVVATGAGTPLPKASLTQEGQILGTVAYMSPEQAEGRLVDARSDVFSLGILLYQMATGRHPFHGDSLVAILSSIVKEAAPPVTELNRSLPHHLGRIIAHCLEKEPERRFQTALDVRNELEQLSKEVEAAASPTPPPRPSARRRGRCLGAAAAAGLVLAVGGYLLLRPGARASAQRQMIAVLPFENLGPPEDAHFAAGITDEITSRLATVSGLGVISRNSALRYADASKTTRQIGEELGVDYVLGGTVRWPRGTGAGRVRITQRLIRVADDTHVWSETYDRTLDDIFEVQSDIARQVVALLGVRLRRRERDELEAKPTSNLEAYEAYVRGLEHTTNGVFPLAARMFERAVELDPDFVLAWAKLVRIYAFSHFNSLESEPTEDWRGKAKQALDRAQALAAGQPAVRLAQGYYHYYVQRDYELALETFEAVAEALPNDTGVLEAMAYIHRRHGRLKKSVAELEAALRLDPRNASLIFELASTSRGLRRFAEADRHFDRGIAAAPDQNRFYAGKATNLLAWKGDTKGARATLERAPEPARLYREWIKVEWFEREFAQALARLAAAPRESAMDQLVVPVLTGLTHLYLDQPAQARRALESAASGLAAAVERQPEDALLRVLLGLTHAGLGRKEDALHAGKAAVRLAAADRVLEPLAQGFLAWIYATVGEKEAALDLLERLLATAYLESLTASLLRLDPAWDPLRDHPRFQALLGNDE